MIWRLIHSQPGEAAWNMALDESILESVIHDWAIPTVRVYSWIRPAISLGRFQQPHRVLNEAICRQRGVAVVKRISGGKAVLHGHDITISVSAPSGILGVARSVVGSHLAITAGFVQGLELLGIEATASQAAGRAELVGPYANCFAASAAGDVTAIDGRKLIGGAQYRRGDCLLEQTSIPVAVCSENLRGVLTDGIELPVSPLVKLERDTVVRSLLAGFAEHLDVQWQPSEPSNDELLLAKQLAANYDVDLAACES